MASKVITLLLVSLLAVTGAAMPATEKTDNIFCPHNYLVEKWGHVLTLPKYNFTRGVGQFRGCASEAVKRDDGFDTTVELNDDTYSESWGFSDSTPNPPHDDLLARYTEVCGDTYCDGTKSIDYLNPEGQTVYTMNLDGEFADSTLRDNFVALIKDALDKALEPQEIFGQPGYGVYDPAAPGFANAVSGYGAASGYSLTVRIVNVSPDGGCPDTVSKIMSFGALVPELGAVFGLAGAICGAV